MEHRRRASSLRARACGNEQLAPGGLPGGSDGLNTSSWSREPLPHAGQVGFSGLLAFRDQVFALAHHCVTTLDLRGREAIELLGSVSGPGSNQGRCEHT